MYFTIADAQYERQFLEKTLPEVIAVSVRR
jgi:hypothetical protein